MEKIIKLLPPSCSIPHIHNPKNSQEPSITDKLESCKSIKQLKQIHSCLIKTPLPLQTQQLIYTKFIYISAKTHPIDISYIHSLVNRLRSPTIDLYNTIIRSLNYDNNINPLMGLLFYKHLLEIGLVPDTYTYPSILKACAGSRALREGEQIHSQVVKNGLVFDLYVVNTLIRFYAVCGLVEAAQKVFDESPQRDLVSWTTLIQGYVEKGCWERGVEVFYEMCEAGVRADEMTMVVVLSACGRIGDLSLGRKLHEYMLEHNLNFDVYIGNALVDMYLKCGDLDSALRVFDKMPVKNVVSWNTMISGLVQQGEFKRALSVFKKMQNRGVKQDKVTLAGVLNCCASLGLLELGKWVHAHIDNNDITADGFVGNALIDMYMKCGSIDDAFHVFDLMKDRDVYTYTTIIVGLAMHGRARNALKIFSELPELGIVPNNVTFLGILMACSHAGLVTEGCNHFIDMLAVYDINPQREHYGCLVDLFGRAGFLNEAEEIIERMNVEPDGLIWGSLLGASRTYENLEMGKSAMEKLVNVKSEDDGAYVLMSNLYSSLNRRRDAVKLRKTMKERKIKKTPGCSSIEVDGVVYEFRKGDKSHRKSEEIYKLLDAMANHLRNS